MFNVDVDPNGWEKVIEETIQDRIQFNTICDQDWYQTKFNLVESQPDSFSEWKIEDGELFYYLSNYEKALIDDEHPWKKVVKSSDIMTILRQNHDIPQAGCLGRDKTLQRIRQNYYCPGMTQDVKSFIKDCETCVKCEYNQRPLKRQLTTKPLQSPWAQLSLTPSSLKRDKKKGNPNLIFIQDLYKKYVELFPVGHRTGKIPS